MSVRNQLTHYELEEFFCSLQDLLVLSLNPSLSFDSAEFFSRRLDCFERTLSVLSSRLRVSYWSEVQQFLTSTLSYFQLYCQATKGTLLGRPIPIVLVKCWKVAHWNAKKLLKNCQKSKKLLPKFQKLLPKFLAIFI